MRYNYYVKSLACLAVMLGCAVSGFAQVYVGTNTPTNTYSTLKEAVEKAPSGKTIYLKQDVTETGGISFSGKTLTLNLKGYKLTLTGEGDEKANISVGAGAKLTVSGGLFATWSVDVSNDYKVTYQDKTGKEQGTLQLDGTIYAENGGQVTISSGNIVSSSTALCAVGDETGASSVNSKITVENGYVKSQNSAVAAKGMGATLVVGKDSKKTADTGPVLEALDGAVIVGYESEKLGETNVSLYNATLIARNQTAGNMACAVYHPQKGTLKIGGSSTNRLKIYSVDGCGILMRGGTMTLNCGATITATGDKSLTGKVGDDSREVVGVNGIVYDYDSDCYDSKNVSVSIPKTTLSAPAITSTADAISVINAKAADISDHIVLQCGTYSSDVSAYADEANGYFCEKEGEVYKVQKYYAQIGKTKYADVTAAFAAVKDGETVKLLQDRIAGNSVLTVTNAVTLDLNGHHLTCHSVVVDGGHLTIQDGTAAAAKSLRGTAAAPADILTGLTGGILDGTGADDYTVLLKNGGTAILVSGTVVNTYKTNPQNNVVFRIEGDAEQKANVKSTLNVAGGKIATIGTPVFVCYKGATVNVTGGELNGSGLAVIAGSGAENFGGTIVNVSGGTLVAGAPSDGTASCGIYNPQDGVVNVSGGTITSEQGPGVLMRSGKLTMTGGTIDAQGDASFAGTVGDAKSKITASGIVFDRDANYSEAANTQIKIQGDVKVMGAKSAIEVVNDQQAEDAKDAVRVVSGTFSSDVSKYCADNYTAAPNGDGTFGIVTGDVVVVTDDSYIVVEAGKDLAFSASTVNKVLVNSELAGVNVQLTKQFSTANWSSFYVPFAITLTEELLQNYDFAKIWDTEYVNDALTLEFKKLSVGDVIPANTPCLIKAKAIGEGVLEFPNVTFKQPTKTFDCSTIEEKFTFYGTLENTTLMDKYGYFINPSTQQFTSVSKPTQYLRPLGFYMTIQNRETEAYIYPTDGEQQKVFGFRVIGDEEATGITEATQSANGVKEGRIYNLQGAFVGTDAENLPAGIYVVNGKKLVIK